MDVEVPLTKGTMPGEAFLAKTGAAYGEDVWC